MSSGCEAVPAKSPSSAASRTLSASLGFPVPPDDEHDSYAHDDQPDQQFGRAHAATQRSQQDDHEEQERPDTENEIPRSGSVRHRSNLQRDVCYCRARAPTPATSSGTPFAPGCVVLESVTTWFKRASDLTADLVPGPWLHHHGAADRGSDSAGSGFVPLGARRAAALATVTR